MDFARIFCLNNRFYLEPPWLSPSNPHTLDPLSSYSSSTPFHRRLNTNYMIPFIFGTPGYVACLFYVAPLKIRIKEDFIPCSLESAFEKLSSLPCGDIAIIQG